MSNERGIGILSEWLSFDLKTLKPIERLSLDKNGGLNSGVHDPVTKQVHFIVSTRPVDSQNGNSSSGASGAGS